MLRYGIFFSNELLFETIPSSNTENFSGIYYDKKNMLVTQTHHTLKVFYKDGKVVEEIRSKTFDSLNIVITKVFAHLTGHIFVGSHDGIIYIIDEKNKISQAVSLDGEINMKEKEKEEIEVITPSHKFEKKINYICWNDDGSKAYIAHENNIISSWNFFPTQATKLQLVGIISTAGPVNYIYEENNILYAPFIDEEHNITVYEWGM